VTANSGVIPLTTAKACQNKKKVHTTNQSPAKEGIKNYTKAKKKK
jgi:hypothetical protein